MFMCNIIGMYIRITTRKNKNGTTAQYVQLAHNEWMPEAKRANAKVLLNLGRREDVDIPSLERLVSSIQRFIGAKDSNGKHANAPALSVKSLKDRRKTAAVICSLLTAMLSAEENYTENMPVNLRESSP